MFEISIAGTDKLNPYEELIKVFLTPAQYRLQAGLRQDGRRTAGEDRPLAGSLAAAEPKEAAGAQQTQEDVSLSYRYAGDADAVKGQIYRDLSRATGKRPKWGILTGIRPVKLAYELAYGSRSDTASIGAGEDPLDQAEEALTEKYLLHPDKAHLAREILDYQGQTAGAPGPNSLSVYAGIPFCPSRCLYCSFTSNQVGEGEIDRYLQALHREIAFAGRAAAAEGFRLESFYMGGGTPTTLSAEQMEALLSQVRAAFDRRDLREFTVEAGRPDTITAEKLSVLREGGADRISINPQSMQQGTLDVIGRRHTVAQTEEAFALARAEGFDHINMDLIAGLPGEDFRDFTDSLTQVLALGADNITLHTLAVKRASRLKEQDENFHYRQEELREQMLDFAARTLRAAGYRPYYLYRQKHTSGSTENIGYCREDKISVYNIRIMEERQSILALGAGGISKIWFPGENRLERVANVSNYEIYIDRIEEMMARKRDRFFGQDR